MKVKDSLIVSSILGKAERAWVAAQIAAQPSSQLVFTLEDGTTVTLNVVTKQVSGS